MMSLFQVILVAAALLVVDDHRKKKKKKPRPRARGKRQRLSREQVDRKPSLGSCSTK